MKPTITATIRAIKMDDCEFNSAPATEVAPERGPMHSSDKWRKRELLRFEELVAAKKRVHARNFNYPALRAGIRLELLWSFTGQLECVKRKSING